MQKIPIWGNEPPHHGDSEADWTLCLDAIAHGVGARHELLTPYTQAVIIEGTVTIARNLAIPEDQIKKWADARQKENAEWTELMDGLSKKELEQSPIAQVLLGVTKLLEYNPNTNSLLN